MINRRFFVDEDAGIAWGNAIFKRDEDDPNDDVTIPAWLYFSELFRVEDGQIRSIYAVMTYVPPEIKTSGWPDGPLSSPP